ncbi:MAG: hypothetical protein GX564_06005 [Oligosphaeraceae bacterium]|nr:hypothetical protein [Oligosphaeraceae bacterium]
MKKFFFRLLHWACVPPLLLLAATLFWSIWELGRNLPQERLYWFFAGGFLAGGLFFTLVSRLTPLYIFGHECTHWLSAKLFFKETGKFRCRASGGFVEIKQPNVWIILAPYFVPFYFLICTGLWGLAVALWPKWYSPCLHYAAIVLGICYAYHVVLTCFALSKGQADLRLKGVLFSLALILAFNALFIYLAVLTTTRQWPEAWPVFARKGQFLLQWLLDCWPG